MNKLDEAKLGATESEVVTSESEVGDAPDRPASEVYSSAPNRYPSQLTPYRFTSSTAREASLKGQANRLDRQVTRALQQKYDAPAIVALFDEAFLLARKRGSPKAFVETLDLLMSYVVGEPIKRQVTATTTLESMMSRYLGMTDSTEDSGEG